MSMPNDKDRDLSPDEGSEEKNYSFLQETIKPKPISREHFIWECLPALVFLRLNHGWKTSSGKIRRQ